MPAFLHYLSSRKLRAKIQPELTFVWLLNKISVDLRFEENLILP